MEWPGAFEAVHGVLQSRAGDDSADSGLLEWIRRDIRLQVAEYSGLFVVVVGQYDPHVAF